jgi:hypothetical protein
VLSFQADIPVCNGCKEHLDVNDSMLTYYERGWLDDLYADLRDSLTKGLEVVVYK